MRAEILEKLTVLGEAAKFDVSCASSGVERKGGPVGTIGSSLAAGICHSFTGDGRCVSLLKVLLSNDCLYDCRYCINRRSSDRPRATFESRELAELTIEFYRRNYIEGLFLSSAVVGSPDGTMEAMCETVRILRREMGFVGYVHMKTIPGASPELVETAGRLADRLSVNIEFPSEAGLTKFAPQKKKQNILGTMRYIGGRMEEAAETLRCRRRLGSGTVSEGRLPSSGTLAGLRLFPPAPAGIPDFAPGGQSTQMIIGATDDTDRRILQLTEALYRRMSLKRVYYSAFVPVNRDPLLPAGPPPLLREHRLYQADWLLRFYGFSADELLSDAEPNLDLEYDPKCTWALRHMQFFPVEINRADRELLLRVPGIGVRSAEKILLARRNRSLDFQDLKKLRVVLKRAGFFITCGGKRIAPLDADPARIRACLGDGAAPAGPQMIPLSFFDMPALSCQRGGNADGSGSEQNGLCV